jgi:hypothetical protein
MILSTLDPETKYNISKTIKPISEQLMKKDYSKLCELYSSENIKLRETGKKPSVGYGTRIGNNFVDYFTFCERLETKGKYNASYFDFIENIEWFKTKKFIQNMLTYYSNTKNASNKKNKYTVYKEVYNICISSINIFRPIVAAEIYCLYKPNTVLDFTCGWGGRLVGASITGVSKYIGIDINTNLIKPYQQMKQAINNPLIDIQLIFQDALTVDYSKLDYDFVLTSPPYYAIEKYSHNVKYNNKNTMNELFYRPLFELTFRYLKVGGHYCLNVNNEIYQNACIPILGTADNKILLKKSSRQNKYQEYIYVWNKEK